MLRAISDPAQTRDRDGGFRRLERAKLVDVGSGREGLIAGLLEYTDLDRAVVIRLPADLCK